MALYKLNQHSTESEPSSVTKEKDPVTGVSLCIPFAPGNTDYQEYLEWVAAGNTPEAAD